MKTTTTMDLDWKADKVKLLVLWFGLDAVFYLGALVFLVLALTDQSLRPFAYAFTIALVTSWALRMAYGIRLELRRVRQEEQEKARKLHAILQQHGLSDDESASLAREIKSLG
jgi:hypothetical protein